MSNVALIEVGYLKFSLPIDEGLVVVRILGQAQSVDQRYVNSKYEYWNIDVPHEVKLQIVDSSVVKAPTIEMIENKELADYKSSLEYTRKQEAEKSACLKAAQARIAELEKQVSLNMAQY